MDKQIVLHPISISLYPTLFLFGAFSDFFGFEEVWRPALLSCCLFVGLWLIIGALRREYKHTAVYISATVLVFFSWAAVLEATTGIGFEKVPLGNKIMLGAVALGLVAVTLIVRFRKYIDEVTYMLNVMGMILLITPIMISALQYYRSSRATALLPDREHLYEADASFAAPAQPPDIYYLVLDGYARADFLADEFDFDNAVMLDFLKERGFYVGERSRANYSITLPALASSLNYEYLDDLLGGDLGDFSDRSFARELIRDSRAVKMLRRAGYSIVSIESAHTEANIADPDVEFKKWTHLSIFEVAVFQMTPVPRLATILGAPILYDLHRDRILYAIDRLRDAAEIPGPKFVYAHILVGHAPFVFGARGERVNRADAYTWTNLDQDRDEYIKGYRDQVSYLNGELRETLTSIIEKSARPPVIVVFGDHGPASRLSFYDLEGTDVKERYSILNAYHLPPTETNLSSSATDPYPSISPVDLPPKYGPVGMRGIGVGGPRSRAALRGASPS